MKLEFKCLSELETRNSAVEPLFSKDFKVEFERNYATLSFQSSMGLKRVFFTGRDFLEASKGSFETILSRTNTSNIILPAQVHGNRIIDIADLSEADREKQFIGEGDAVIGSFNPTRADRDESYLVGVRTADCLPMLLVLGNYYCLIHAGWRGLANKIIEKSLKLLIEKVVSGYPQFKQKEELFVVLGVAAGVNEYEVGREVIEEIGETAYNKEIENKVFLDIYMTAIRKVFNSTNDIRFKQRSVKSLFSVKVKGLVPVQTTIGNIEFFSNRSDGGVIGHNYTFLEVN